jgi:hypothetical protein
MWGLISVSILILLLTWVANDGFLLDLCFSLSIWRRKWRHGSGRSGRFAAFRGETFGHFGVLTMGTGWILGEKFSETLLLERGE